MAELKCCPFCGGELDQLCGYGGIFDLCCGDFQDTA